MEYVIISHTSALIAWHDAVVARAREVGPSAIWLNAHVELPFDVSKSQLVPASCDQYLLASNSLVQSYRDMLPQPIDLLVSSRAGVFHTSKTTRYHLASNGRLPQGSLCQIGKNLLICSPELTFIQMAGTLPIEDLIELGYGMCGTYCRTFDTVATSEDKKFVNCPPVTSVQRISDYLDSYPSIRCGSKVRRALKYIRDGADSPRETTGVMLLCLSRLLGGLNRSFPLLNASIDATDDPIARQSHYTPDYAWLEQKLLVDYDSNLEHSSPSRMRTDAARRNALEHMGYRHYILTNDAFSNIESFDANADVIRQYLHERQRTTTEQQRINHLRLFNYLVESQHAKRWERLFCDGVWDHTLGIAPSELKCELK